ncbi:MAG: hypothetical protein L6408_06805 [Nanoarchaeota archaeon]|nr:hypothetical protein [Nanoarchaeota archaeon]
MRTLIYVPIIHSGADMGSIASNLEDRGSAMIGTEGWERHKETISRFWESISKYFKSLNAKGFQIYQDGLLADGELGMKVVNSAAAKGSKNYQIIKYLVSKSARIMKTEDMKILMKEVDIIKKIANSDSKLKKLISALHYKMVKDKLLAERDKFIANMINKTLVKDGIIFIGAYHNIIPLLNKDIKVEEIKEKAKVEEYQKIFFLKSREGTARKLAKYLTAPV